MRIRYFQRAVLLLWPLTKPRLGKKWAAARTGNNPIIPGGSAAWRRRRRVSFAHAAVKLLLRRRVLGGFNSVIDGRVARLMLEILITS